MRDTERGTHRQREKQAPCREPDTGLDPWSPGSRPGPKAGAKLLSHPGIPDFSFNLISELTLISLFQKKIYLFVLSQSSLVGEAAKGEGEAGSLQEARCGTRSWDSRIAS